MRLQCVGGPFDGQWVDLGDRKPSTKNNAFKLVVGVGEQRKVGWYALQGDGTGRSHLVHKEIESGLPAGKAT